MKSALAILIVTILAGADSPIVWSSDAAMHDHFTLGFLNSTGRGYSRMWQPPMRVTDSMWLTLNGGGYKLGTVQLVGIANHEEPVVYVDILHRDVPSERETRKLTAFEDTAITYLRSAGDVVVDSSSKHRIVVGALRARTECLSCHRNASAGDLLGAFTYRLDSASVPTE